MSEDLTKQLKDWDRKSTMQSLVGSSTPVASAVSSGSQSKTPGRNHTGAGVGLASLSSLSSVNANKPKTPGKGALPNPGAAYGDRFIPNRDALNLGAIQFVNSDNTSSSTNPADKLATPTAHNPNLNTAGTGNGAGGNTNSANNNNNNAGGAENEFNAKLAESVLGENVNAKNHKILAFKHKAPKPSEAYQNQLRVLYTQNKAAPQQVVKKIRHISSTPERILDAPDMMDDFYLNLLEWGPTGALAVALGPAIYLWNSMTGSIDLLCEAKNPNEYVCSVSWMGDGSHLAVGTSNNDVQLWDVAHKKQVRNMRGHQARVTSLAWNEHLLSSGSRDNMIFHHDVRIAQHHVHTLRGHSQEICGLKWSLDGTQLASGGNDNTVCIWDASASSSTGNQPRYTFTDSAAAVKALAWCPFQKHLLATGGGTADRHIRFYNTQTGALLNSIDTKSQVCSLQWSKHDKELLSAHGFSQNQLSVWKYPSLVKVADLMGHTSRVLHTTVSPDGTTVCSAAADETLRFWKVWEPIAVKKKSTPENAHNSSTLMNLNIR